MDNWTIQNFSQPEFLENGPGSADASRLLEVTASNGTAEDVENALEEFGPFETLTTAFAIAVARGQTQMARLLGRPGNEMRKATGGDHGDFMVCGGSIAMSGYYGHPHFPDDFFQIEVDGSNCRSILELCSEGYFGPSVTTTMLSSCLYEVGRYGQELRRNEDYYVSQGESRFSEDDLATWREREAMYLDTAEKLCKIAGSSIEVKRLLGGRLEVYAYDRVTEFLCSHFPSSISAAWVPSRWRFDEKRLSRRELVNLKIVFPCLDPLDIPRKESLMRCLAINGMTDELRIMSEWPGLFTDSSLTEAIDLAAANGHPDTAGYLLDCKTSMFPPEDAGSLFL